MSERFHQPTVQEAFDRIIDVTAALEGSEVRSEAIAAFASAVSRQVRMELTQASPLCRDCGHPGHFFIGGRWTPCVGHDCKCGGFI